MRERSCSPTAQRKTLAEWPDVVRARFCYFFSRSQPNSSSSVTRTELGIKIGRSQFKSRHVQYTAIPKVPWTAENFQIIIMIKIIVTISILDHKIYKIANFCRHRRGLAVLPVVYVPLVDTAGVRLLALSLYYF